MKVVLAYDSFKGCMTAEEACLTTSDAIREILPGADVVCIPLSDGGEGLVDCVEKVIPVERIMLKAHDPLMNIIDASYVVSGDVAYMEMAETSGLTLVPMEKRNPMLTTTYGVGEMIVDATKRGFRKIVLGIGGSATCDGGKGMLEAIENEGVDFCSIPSITVACDVTNPLYGQNGASYVFSPQKGANKEQVIELDNRLRAFAQKTEKAGYATPELALCPGTGAAGGLGYGLMAYLKAQLKSGIDIILDINKFDNIINDADLVITGEGKSDEQTLMGKVPDGVSRRCLKMGIPTWLLSGAIDDKNGELHERFHVVKSINEGDGRPLVELMRNDVAKSNMFKTIQKLIK